MELNVRYDPDILLTGSDCARIEAALTAFPLCRSIAEFLAVHHRAMDTASGIAAWWVGSDVPAVQAALDCLVACGIVVAHTRTCGTIFGLNRHPAVRDWLRGILGEPSERRRPDPEITSA